MSKFDFVGETKKILSGYEENNLAPLGFEIDNSDNLGYTVWAWIPPEPMVVPNMKV